MKLKTIYLQIIFASITICSLSAQPETFRFAKTGTDVSIEEFKVDSMGYNYVIGTYNQNFEYQSMSIVGNPTIKDNLFILKTTPSGEPVYLHSIHGTGDSENISLQKFTITESGELYIVVSIYNTTELVLGNRTINVAANQSNTVVARFSKRGYLTWTKTIFTLGVEPQLEANDIEVDESGNLYIAGSFSGDSAVFNGRYIESDETINTMFLAKYLKDGSISWASSCEFSTDSTGSIYANDVELSKQGTIYVSGYYDGSRQFTFNSDILINRGVSNAYLAAFNSDGDAEWAIPYEGPGSIIPGMIKVDKQGDAFFTCFYKTSSMIVDGTTFSSINDFNLLTSSIKSNKEFTWKQSLNTNLEYAYRGARTAILGVNDSSDCFLLAEFTSSTNGIFTISYNNTGTLLWVHQSSGPGNVKINKGHIDKNGNILFYGRTTETFTYQDSIFTDISGYSTSYFCKQLNTGKLDVVFRKQNNMDNNVTFSRISSDVYGNVYLPGSYYGAEASLDTNFLSGQNTDGFVLSEYSLNGTISGKAIDFYSTPFNMGKVVLIDYTNNRESSIADSAQIKEDGTFKFDNVPIGKYLLYFNPEGNDADSYMPTYFPTFGSWEQAGHIVISKTNLENTNTYILVPEAKPLKGKARLSGGVTTVDENDVFKSTNAKPKSKSRASLSREKLKSEYEIIAVTETDDNGNFEFNDVEDGFYVVLIDIPGLPTLSPHIVTVTNGIFVSNINYYISEEDITAIDAPHVSANRNISKSDTYFNLYPNPSSGSINIELPEGEKILEVSIQNLQGKTIEQHYNLEQVLSLRNIPPGIYFANIVSNKKQETIKFIITP